MNCIVAALSWCSLGRPGGGAGAEALVGTRSELQRNMVHSIGQRLEALRRGTGRVALPAGGLTRLHNSLSELAATSYTRRSAGTSVAQPISPENFSLPPTAPHIHLCAPHIPRVLSWVLDAPGVFDLPAKELPHEAPGCCMTLADWEGVATTLWDAQLLYLVDLSLVPHIT